MTIFVDTREKDSTYSTRIKQLGVEVEVKTLPIGDIWVGNLVIERKTIDDFFSSIPPSDRYYNQLYNMKLNIEKNNHIKCVVYIIGLYPYITANRYPIDIERTLRTHKSRAIYSYGIPVIQVPSDDEFIKDIIEYHNITGKSPSLKPIDCIRKADTIEDMRVNIYGSVSGVGKNTANYLAKKYPIPKLFDMTSKELRELRINGGKKLGKKGENIWNVFHSEK